MPGHVNVPEMRVEHHPVHPDVDGRLPVALVAHRPVHVQQAPELRTWGRKFIFKSSCSAKIGEKKFEQKKKFKFKIMFSNPQNFGPGDENFIFQELLLKYSFLYFILLLLFLYTFYLCTSKNMNKEQVPELWTWGRKFIYESS